MEKPQDVDAVKVFGGQVDFGRTSSDYARFRAGFPDTFFDRIVAAGIGGKNKRVLDLGSGTGTIARGFALRGSDVVGVDKAAAMIESARALDRAAGVTVQYVTGAAEHLDFPASMFDVVIAGQCWHWFDRPKVAAECRRVLRPGGHMLIAHFDWIPLPGNVVALTEALINAHNPAWNMGGGTGVYPVWLADLATAGFYDIETHSFDVAQPYTHEGWRGRIRASAGISASLTDAQVKVFDTALAAVLAVKFPDPMNVPHRVWWVQGRRP